MESSIFKKLYLGFLQAHVLYHASKESIFGLMMMNELNSHGYQIGPSHIYPLLNQMEKQGLLKKEERNEFGKVRKYYDITSLGLEVLRDIRIKVKELSDELID